MTASQTTVSRPLIPGLRALEDSLAPLAEPLIRVAAGLFLMPHGAQKLFGWFGGYGIDETGAFFITVYSLPSYLAVIAGVIEFFGGLLLALGLATRPAAALITGMMAVVVVHVHWSQGFFWTQNGVEYPLMWGIIAFAYLLRGGGRYSLDHIIGAEL